MLTNIDIAILNRVNELANRYGFSPCDFVATIRHDKKGNAVLAFEAPFSGEEARQIIFFRMLDSLGVVKSTGQVIGTDTAIISALDKAMQAAPKLRRHNSASLWTQFPGI